MSSFSHVISTSWCPYPLSSSFKPQPLPASSSPLDVFDDYYHVDEDVPTAEPSRPSRRYSHAVRTQHNPDPLDPDFPLLGLKTSVPFGDTLDRFRSLELEEPARTPLIAPPSYTARIGITEFLLSEFRLSSLPSRSANVKCTNQHCLATQKTRAEDKVSQPSAPRRPPPGWFSQFGARDRIRHTVAVEREKSKVGTSVLERMNQSTGLIFCDACLLEMPSPLFVLVGCRHAVCEQCADKTGFKVRLPRPDSMHLTCPRCKRSSEVVSMQHQHDKSQPHESSDDDYEIIS